MKRLMAGVGLLLVAGCGSGDNAAAVTPVMADTRGTYRLISSRASLVAPDGTTTGATAQGGVLRLFNTTYTRTVSGQPAEPSGGSYMIGTSVNTTLNGRSGTFTLTSAQPPFIFTGTYQATADFTLTLNYDRYALPDQTLVTGTETWEKESDYPRHDI